MPWAIATEHAPERGLGGRLVGRQAGEHRTRRPRMSHPLVYPKPAITELTTDPMRLWRAAALLRCELKHGEVENEV